MFANCQPQCINLEVENMGRVAKFSMRYTNYKYLDNHQIDYNYILITVKKHMMLMKLMMLIKR